MFRVAGGRELSGTGTRSRILEGGRKERRDGGREGRRKGGREGDREEGKQEGSEGGVEGGGKEGGREGGRDGAREECGHTRCRVARRHEGSGSVQGSGFKVQVSGFRVQGSGFRVQGLPDGAAARRQLWASRPSPADKRVPGVDIRCSLLIVPLLRGSSGFDRTLSGFSVA